MSETKNIGQVVGLFIGTVPPTNTNLIWYDETSNQRCHKVYNPTTKEWMALNPEIIMVTTYSELVNNAKKNGLVIGKRYQIRDKDKVLATAITVTKIQYIDNAGNIIIDDLGTNAIYHVSSSNIQIDDINGVVNKVTNKLVFSFQEITTPDFETDYLFGKVRSGAKWILAKFKFKNLLSTSTGNSLEWKNGFFFNFSNAIKAILNKKGGVVGKDVYDKKMLEVDTAISNTSKENQNIITNASKEVTDATTDKAIYNKKLPINIDTTVAAGDIQINDTLATIVSKFQRWVLQFKYATGIRLSLKFADATSAQYINNNDTVESAFGKIQYYLKNPMGTYKLPADFDKPSDSVTLGSLPIAGDTLYWAFIKLKRYLQNIWTVAKLPSDWKPISYTANFKTPDSGDSLSDVIAKIVGKLNQIGIIYNGVVESRERNDETTSQEAGSGTPRLKIDLNNGKIISNYQANAGGIEIISEMSADLGFRLKTKTSTLGEEERLIADNTRFEWRGKNGQYYDKEPYKILNAQGGKFPIGFAVFNNGYTAFSAKCLATYGYNYYDAFFSNIKLGGLTFDTITTEENYYVSGNTSLVMCNTEKGNNINVYLPANPETGRIVYVVRSGNGGVNVFAQGNNGIDKIGSSSTNVGIDSRGQVYMFMFVRSIIYSGETRVGLWQFAKLIH